jgi:competence protein ComFC
MNTCQVLNKLKENILDILFPRFCVGCGREGLYICKDCEVFLSEVDPALMCALPRSAQAFPKIVSVWEYEGLMEKLIHKIKFDGCYDIIDELVEKAMEKIELNLPEDTVLTFVPMRKKWQRKRGFNQSELIARKLAVYLPRVNAVHPREVCGLLEKVRDNRSQVGLGPKEREENVRGVFAVAECLTECLTLNVTHACGTFNVKYSVKNVLLVDDVYTTGATINECAKVLKKAGVKNVWVFTLARKFNV